MRDWTGKRYWLVGASEGLGRAVAFELSRKGVELVLSARNSGRLQDLADELPGRAHVVPLDVADNAAIRGAAEQIGEVDGVVYLAGAYWPMPLSDWDAEQAETMCEVNLSGAVSTVSAVLPGMIERDAGHLVLTGSIGGFRGLPGSAAYGASKAGVMVLAESLYADLRRTGVEVQIVNPGYIRTRLTDRNEFSMPFLMEPEDAARALVDHMCMGSFKRSFPWPLATAIRLGQLLPDWLYFRIFS